MSTRQFGYEDLKVWNMAVDFATDKYTQLEEDAKEIASMIKGLINSISMRTENL